MADILPFRAFRYDPQKVSYAQVVTQPYDKITTEMQKRYYAASPYNLVRIILGRGEPNDNPANNVYVRAAANFRDWRGKQVIRQDAQPSIYSYTQRFSPPQAYGKAEGTTLERRGFIALGRVEDYSQQVVFRHEQTLSKPKADRLELLRATRAHFGQLFMLYEDDGQVDALLSTEHEPAISVTDEYGVVHSLKPVADASVIAAVQDAMKDKKLIIADGHHRYETALNYRNEQREAAGKNASPEAPYEFAMMTFVNMKSPALVILPTHRVVHGLAEFSADEFRKSAKKYFDVEEVDGAITGTCALATLRECGRAGTTILAVAAQRAFLLHHPNPNANETFRGVSVRQQALDVVQLHKCLLEHVLGLSEESIRNQQNLSYLRDANGALTQVREGRANVAFLMNPCRMAQVRDIAFAGEVMPQKSTDFYPKLLSGLAIYALD